MHIIYIAINKINGKSYIGKTKRGLALRSLEHLKASRTGSKTYFHSALRVYGEGSFVWDILEYNVEDALASAREQHWILKYKSAGYELYNLTDGGDGSNGFKGHKHTEATKKLIGNRKPRSEEWKRNNAELVKARAKPCTLCKNGICIQIDNINEWSKSNNYTPSLVYSVVRGIRKSAYGWTLHR